MHIPPDYTRIRHYGFLSNASKRKSPSTIRKSLKVTEKKKDDPRPWQKIAFDRMGIKPGTCKNCGSRMVPIESCPNRFRRQQRAPPNRFDAICQAA
jgi:RNase P subunit RPR2